MSSHVIFDGLRPRGRLRSRALVKEPKVPLAVEPTGHLDEDTRDEIITLLDTMWQEGGLTMVFATHDSTVARRAADRR